VSTRVRGEGAREQQGTATAIADARDNAAGTAEVDARPTGGPRAHTRVSEQCLQSK